MKKVLLHDSSEAALPTNLCLSWALVLALYTNSFDVLFGLLDDREGKNKGADAIVPCHLTLQPEDVVRTASETVDQYWNISRHFEQQGLDNLRTTSAEATRICDFHNILVIRPLEALEETRAILTSQISSSYPLVLTCGLDNQRVAVHAMFDSGVVCYELVESILHQFAFTLGQVSTNLEARLVDIQASNPEDLEKNVAWNKLNEVEKCTECVHHLVERHCRERPFAPAICAWDGELSYGELDKQASYIAEQLSRVDVGPDKLVFIMSEKSKWTPVAILASLKAGGGFSLLDPSQPAHRLATLCDLATPQLILASRRHSVKASLLGPPVMIIQDMGLGALDETSENPNSPILSTVESHHHTLHVGFTSGSTGTPKGVLTDHAAFTSGHDVSGLSRESRVLQSTSYNFSACMWEHLVTLTRGACLCIPSEDQLENDVERAICELGVTWAMITPSVARVIEPQNAPSIETLFLVGEAIGRLEISKWAEKVALYSMYAQSECGSPIMTKRIFGPEDLSTLGHPGSAVGWIVDSMDHNRLMPLGAEGELVLQGPCLARSYVNNAEQTTTTFIADPAWARQVGMDTPNRFLKTGDVFSRSPIDGSFQFRGRKGGKVKIRGQRIELAEVEYHLRSQFPQVPHVVAEIVRPSDSDSQYGMLVAVIPSRASPSDGTPNICRLLPPDKKFLHHAQRALDQLSKGLPTYMIPNSFISVESLPRTASGKLHRRLLAETLSQLSRKEILAYMTLPKVYRAPSTITEATLQSVCARVLSIEPEEIGMDDNFLGLGGDSLSARQMVTFARAEGLSITVADCLQQANLTSLANCAQDSRSLHVKPVPIRKDPDPFNSLREDFLHDLPQTLTTDMIEDIAPVREAQLFLVQYRIIDYLLIRISGLLDPVKLRRACESLVKSHTMLRTIFARVKDEHVQVVLRNVEVPWEAFTASTDSYDPDMWAHSQCADDRKTPAPTNGPFLKFILLQDDRTRQHTLIMRISHAQFDGLCLENILQDFAKLYEDQPLRIQSTYADYVRKCAEMRTEGALRFWSDLLAGSTPTSLPLTPSMDHTQEEACVVAAQDIPIAIPPPSGATWATVVKAAWSYVLWQKTGKDDLTFCQMVNCRYVDVPEPEQILGPCLNPIPVRVKYDASWTVRDLLGAVQNQHIASLEYQTLEWTDIVSNCTEWHSDTEIDSIVLHENINASPAAQVGEAVWRVSAHSVDNPPERTIYLYTYPEQDSLYAVLILSSKFGGKADAEGLVKSFCSAVALFVNSPDTLLCSL
ncbi:hypothetical protein P175DRAFT_0437861 [Aspergillus ochraceoroseus IBT 24754]|nr:uncharacterized protein P175DRAFT_0437861 [Aspergillus ochraceoroseus IBT 24754]PTU21176.1 hypothetical protein P175DRAFT_0437861 [Aspergillus ochraceoroseus IBT 24754]